MPIKLTGDGQPVVSDKPEQRYDDSSRPVGARSIYRGRPVVWAGPDWRWQSTASFERLKSSGRLNRSILSDPLGVIGNELRYIGRQMSATNARAGDRQPLRGGLLDRFGQVLARQGRDATRVLASPLPAVTALATPFGQTGRNLSAAVAVGAAENAAKLAVAAAQKARGRRANPESSRANGLIESVVDTSYRALGATPPGQQNQFERGLDATARSFGTAAAGTTAAVPLVPAVGGGAAGAVITGGARWALGELLSTLADDNRGGNVMNLGEAVTGKRLPLAVDVGQDDWLDSAFKSLLPNAAPGVALSGLGEALGGFRHTRRWLSGQRTIAERAEARQRLENAGITETDPATGAATLREAEAGAQQQIDSWIAAGQDPGAKPPPPPPPAAPSRPAPPEAATPTPAAAAPEGAPAAAGDAMAVDGADITAADFVYDPTLPEADVVLNLVRELDDAELQQLAAGADPVVPQLDQILQAREAMPVRPDLEQGLVMAPSGSVAERIGPGGQPLTYEQTLEAMPMETLRSVAAPENNADLARVISDLAGRGWEEFTKADIIEGLGVYQRTEGQSLLVRDWSQNMRPTASIAVDPQRFQFKGNTNAAGEQLGNSLSGVNRWDTIAEGAIDVWTDPANGVTYVVNGHNRLARADQLGIPSLPVRELQAATAGEARAMGALANIKEGRGTVFDAAKFMRESGITTPEQLQRMGAPMSDGHAARGLALSQLPDDIFQAAVDGRLSVGKAAALGGSGLDEAQMREAFRALGGRDMSDAKFNEIVQQVRSAPTMQDEQPDIWGDRALVSLMEQKADLAVAIRQDLLKDKRFFSNAAKGADRLEQAGNRINVQGNKEIAADADQVLRTFDQLKYTAGPVSELLNDGARQIAEGAKPRVIADRIRDQIAEAVRRSLDEQGLPTARSVGAAEAPPTREELDAVKLDPETQAIFDELEGIAASMGERAGQNAQMARRGLEASAGIEDIDGGPVTDRVVPSPRALTPEQRDALQLDVIRKAVANAEVRPPESPFPELPDGPTVQLDVAAAELEGQRGRPTPGTKGAQAMADELRLAAEFHERDAEMRAITEEGLRDAVGYELKTFEEKKGLGMADGYDLLPPGTDLIHGTSRKAAESIMATGFRPSRAAAGGAILGDGVYMTPNPRYAGGYGDTAVAGALPDGARILDLVGQGRSAADFAEGIGVGRPAEMFEGEAYFSNAQQAQIRQWALDNGYDGIKFDPAFNDAGTSASEVVVYNLDLANRMVGAQVAKPPVRPQPLHLADTPAPAAKIDIPAAASTRLGANRSRDVGNILYRRANAGFPEGSRPIKSLDQAIALVQAKGRMLWPEKVPGLDLDKALNDEALGRYTPEVEGIAAAYRQFYGVPEPATRTPASRTKAADDAARKQIADNDKRMAEIRRQAQQEGC
jgi:hypothetical protein